MGIENLLNKKILRGQFDEVMTKSHVKLSQLRCAETERATIVSAALCSQVIVLAAIKKFPRIRAVIDDAQLIDVQKQCREFVAEILESEYLDGAGKVYEAMKNFEYVDQLAVWQCEFILTNGSVSATDTFLDSISEFMRWVRQMADATANSLVSQSERPNTRATLGELDLKATDEISLNDESKHVFPDVEQSRRPRQRSRK